MFRFVTKLRRPPPNGGPIDPSRPASPSIDAQDVALIGRIVEGDMRAFETLYRSYHSRLSRFIALLCARQPIVEESLNDTMLVVWKRASTYNHQSKVSTWIFAIAYRTACKAMRRQDLPAEGCDDDTLAPDAAGPEQRLSDGEMRAALRRALDSLSNEQRSALVLAYFHDLPYAEIAQIMECPVDTVKTRVFHGRRRLRAMLAGGIQDWL